MLSRKEILKANIEYHTKLADYYYKEPTYKLENIERVEKIISLFRGDSLLDIGCGTGFVIDIARGYFKEIVGLDATQSMLDKVKLDCNIKVKLGNCEELPFGDNSFDVCTAYALLHHLKDVDLVLKEAYRVLKSGGILYTDADPNRAFWNAISSLPKDEYSSMIEREIKAVEGEVFELDYIDKSLYKKAEYAKYNTDCFDASQLLLKLSDIGFRESNVNYNWFLGEADITHGENTKGVVKEFQQYMQSILPLSSHLFKYLSIVAKK